MLKNILSCIVVIALFAGLLYAFSPAFRTGTGTVTENFGWTTSAQEADPVGYSLHVENLLKNELADIKNEQKALSRLMDANAKMLAEKTRLLDGGRALAEQFAEANSQEKFPTEILGRSYDREQLHNQLSLVLAQISGFEELIKGIKNASKEAEAKIRERIVAVDNIETQIHTLSVDRELYKTTSRSKLNKEMLASARDLLREAQILSRENPVRSVQQLIEESNHSTKEKASDAEVAAFLTDYSAKKGKNLVQNENVPAAPGD